MIQKVHIAPLEQWCEGLRARDIGDFHLLEGLEVELETDSMKRREDITEHCPGLCEGPFWRVTSHSRTLTGAVLFRPSVGFWVCRHQLEMD